MNIRNTDRTDKRPRVSRRTGPAARRSMIQARNDPAAIRPQRPGVRWSFGNQRSAAKRRAPLPALPEAADSSGRCWRADRRPEIKPCSTVRFPPTSRSPRQIAPVLRSVGGRRAIVSEPPSRGSRPSVVKRFPWRTSNNTVPPLCQTRGFRSAGQSRGLPSSSAPPCLPPDPNSATHSRTPPRGGGHQEVN